MTDHMRPSGSYKTKKVFSSDFVIKIKWDPPLGPIVVSMFNVNPRKAYSVLLL